MREMNSINIDSTIKRLLSYATSELKVDEEYRKYISLPNRKLYSTEANGRIISCIGIEIYNSKNSVIKHIAVLPKERGNGIGSSMIKFVCREHNLRSISAETDKDAVLFYANFGFHITNLGEKYPGTERFLCKFDVK
ncbi:GNAT family N-acetyltransferase [Priestia filamentosa]|jgi:N-acetylglutamate synthase-like GNAT family acetyltransferase|uniref:GNAT family N-acetyltransferase n=1 Tax=Priestia filamentosa TaxID=1402861 RepID=UPI0028961182|nr:GNAT family N-acetyltransferase [Priestia filamentosa]MDT3766400.1 GNAT family N-acetyltransferase [Priestia filamentosa]